MCRRRKVDAILGVLTLYPCSFACFTLMQPGVDVKSLGQPVRFSLPQSLQLRRKTGRHSVMCELSCVEQSDTKKMVELEVDYLGRQRVMFSEHGWNTWYHTPQLLPEDMDTMSGQMRVNASAPSAAGEQGKRVKAKYKVNYIQHGERGMPIVLVHGFGASGFHWRYQIAGLASSHRVYALDLLGFGFSDKPNITYCNTLWGHQLGDFIRQVVGEPCVVVGNSLGGIICLQAAALNATGVLGLALINTPGDFAHTLSSSADVGTQPLDSMLIRSTKTLIRRTKESTKTLIRRTKTVLRGMAATAIAASTATNSPASPLRRIYATAAAAIQLAPPREEPVREEPFRQEAAAKSYLFVPDDIRKAFDLLDVDASGSIQLHELECALRTLGIEPDEEELSKMIRDIDADGSGSVDFGEFVTAWRLLLLLLVLPSLPAAEAVRRLADAQPLLLKALEQQQQVLEGLLRTLAGAVLELTRQQVPALLQYVYVNKAQVDEALVRSIQHAAEAPEAADAFYRISMYALQNIGHPSAARLLGLVASQTPLLVLWGTQDKLVDPLAPKKIQAVCHARQQPYEVKLIPEASHCAHDDEPDRISIELQLFVSKYL